ncbi:hypothetical protein [Thetidibacter halocola]|uniref:Uncharacterized protein n=1 Tax=Thetidibacter halocola TaxID=2827239 RepID=A0A8J7WH33_9RHOB|nr:hypothetical protein [Thetidibacter halocola]MBS0124899.1 hypothetical protein [Thetidibacter halocola]
MPVYQSQIPHFLGSNTRAATVIRAITSGGIGVMIAQAIQTRKDREELSYCIGALLIASNWFPGRLRARLIERTG